MASEQLTIEIEYKDHGAKGKIDDLTSSVNALNAATTGKGFKSLGHVAKNLATIANSASGLGDIGRKLNELAVGSTKVFDAFRSFDPKSYSNNIKSLTTAINSISNAVGNLSQKGSGLKAVADALKQLPSAANAKRGAGLSGMQTSAKNVKAVFKELGNDMKKVISIGWQLGKMPFKMILTPIANIGKGLKNMTTKFGSFLSGIGRIALYRAIRTGIKLVTSAVKDGVNHLYVWAGMVGNSFKPTMDSLATSFMYLKNSIGAAVSPILDALAPAFEALINQIVDVLNIFNQVIATMTGASTWRKALRAAASYSDNIGNLGHEAEDSADAVKELKRTILGFDEINKLEDKMKALSPKKNGKDATGMYDTQGAFSFVEVPIEKTALDIAKMLKKAWETADFTGIGSLVAQKIAGILNSIEWDKVKAFAKKFATSLGTFINGLLDYNGKGGKALWDAVASTIYNGINTAILGYVTFFDTVHWEGIGEGIGAALRNVCENINWTGESPNLADALAAFPNAVIDTLTGFTKRFTVDDFYNLGKNVGETVSLALTKINWTGLFGNAVTIATGVLAALNGALENFDWSGVKDAILTGIKSVPKKSWKNLGTNIGNAIFNVVDFTANLVDTLVAVLKAVKWGDLIKDIWTGIDKSVKKKYGSWGKAANKLAGWFVENLDVISLVLAFSVGRIALKALAKNFAASVMTKLGLAKVPGTSASLGAWAKAISLTAGIVLAIDGVKTILDHNFKKSSISSNLIAMLKGAGELGVAGAAIGFTFGGPAGALIGAVTGVIISLLITGFQWDPFDEKTKKELSAGLQETIDRELADAQANLDSMDYNNAHAMWGQQTVTSKQNRTYGAGNKGQKWNEVTVTLKPTVDTTTLPLEWNNLAKAWADLTKKNKVAKFITEGLRNDGKTWWERLKEYWGTETKSKKASKFQTEGVTNEGSTWWGQLTGFWKTYITGKNAACFTTEGVQNKASTWWSQLTGFWNAIVGPNRASRFKTEGVTNQSSEWWRQVAGFWSVAIAGVSASPFSIAGVVNGAVQWWQQTKGYWHQATSGSELKANVGIANTTGALSAAWNVMQTWFNNNPLSVAVKAVADTTSMSKAYQALGSTSSGSSSSGSTGKTTVATVGKTSTGKTLTASNGALNLGDDAINIFKKRKATGGIYKNGVWHDITAFAAGGFPSGEMFIAREAGPELVGTIGGNTAVMNNDQIVASVSAGVAQAVSGAMGGGNVNEITIKIDSETLYRMVKKGERKASGRYGTAIAIG